MVSEAWSSQNREVGLEWAGPQGVATRVGRRMGRAHDGSSSKGTGEHPQDTAQAPGDWQAQGHGDEPGPGWTHRELPQSCNVWRSPGGRGPPTDGKRGVSPFWCSKRPGRLPTRGLKARPRAPPLIAAKTFLGLDAGICAPSCPTVGPTAHAALSSKPGHVVLVFCFALFSSS